MGPEWSHYQGSRGPSLCALSCLVAVSHALDTSGRSRGVSDHTDTFTLEIPDPGLDIDLLLQLEPMLLKPPSPGGQSDTKTLQ